MPASAREEPDTTTSTAWSAPPSCCRFVVVGATNGAGNTTHLKNAHNPLFLERETVESQGWNKKTTNRRLKVRLSRQRARGRESRQIMALSSSRVFLRGGWIALDGLPNRFVPYGVVSIPLDSWKMCDTRLFLVSKRPNRKGLHSLNHGAALTSPSLAAWPYTFSPSLLCCQVASSQNKKVFFLFS